MNQASQLFAMMSLVLHATTSPGVLLNAWSFQQEPVATVGTVDEALGCFDVSWADLAGAGELCKKHD